MKGKAIRVEIGRVDREGFHGWIVTIRKNGLERLRRFAEETYRSPSAAFAAAVRFRNRIVSRNSFAADDREKGTGIPGISIGRVRTTAGRYVKHYKVSVYGADGRRRALVFSWLKHGKERALQMAQTALQQEREKVRRARRSLKKQPRPKKEEKDRLTSALERSKPTEHKNVRRVDHHYFHGYVVALGRAQSRCQKYFSDGARAVVGAPCRRPSNTATPSSRSFPLPSGSIGERRTRREFPESRSSTIAPEPAESSRGS